MVDPIMVNGAVEQWIKVYKSKPVLTLIMSILIVTILGVGGYFLDQFGVEKREQERLKTLSYQNQITHLAEMETNIYDLLEFIEHQKTSLQEYQDLIVSLRSEKKKLEPIVKANRKIVNAIFEAQENRNKKDISMQRWIGFILGVFASLIASIIWQIARLIISKNKKA